FTRTPHFPYTTLFRFYIVAHASRFVVPGSVRVASNITGNIHNAAFVRPDGQKVLIVLNDDDNQQTFNIGFKGKKARVTLDGGSRSEEHTSELQSRENLV